MYMLYYILVERENKNSVKTKVQSNKYEKNFVAHQK